MRRFLGVALDGIKLDPHETAYRNVFSGTVAHLRLYGTERPGSPIFLIVPAPIKGPYIWDLAPARSVVRQAMDHGYQVHLVEWLEPAGSALAECIEAIATRYGSSQVVLAGHSLGGTLVALYAACRPERVAALRRCWQAK